MGLSRPPPLSERSKQVTVACEKHGDFEGVAIRMMDGEWRMPDCPECKKEREAEAEKAKAESLRKEKAQAAHAKFKASGVPPRFADKSLMNYDPADGDRSALAACIDYAENFPDAVKQGRCLILCGSVGMGKTHLACGIIRHAIFEHHARARYITAASVCRKVKETYQKNAQESEEGVLLTMTDCDLLVVDEIGVQFGSEDERRILFEVINRRYENLKPTIVISNLNISGITEYLGDRAMDRLRENGGIAAIIKGESYRRKTPPQHEPGLGIDSSAAC